MSTEVAYQYVRKKIMSGEYTPGQSLVSEILAAESGTSRTPVRDALRRLEADGLVTIRPRSGASVKTMGMQEFIETCNLRLAMESHAGNCAAKLRTEADLREMLSALDGMRRLVKQLVSGASTDPVLVAELKREDIRFHLAIMSAARNELMKREILRLHLINRLIVGPTMVGETPQGKLAWDKRRKDVLASHELIYKAIAKGDGDGARRALADHIQDFLDTNLRLMAERRNGSILNELAEAAPTTAESYA